MNSTCEICDTPEDCLAGKFPCSLCGMFIAPVPAETANQLLETNHRLGNLVVKGLVSSLEDL